MCNFIHIGLHMKLLIWQRGYAVRYGVFRVENIAHLVILFNHETPHCSLKTLSI